MGTEMSAKRKKKPRLAAGMVRVIVLCWMVPYLILSALLIYIYTNRNERLINDTVSSALGYASDICENGINAAIEDSRQASYDGVIKTAYEQWQKDGNEAAMYRTVNAYLSDTYKYSKTISNTMLLYDEPMQMEYYTYSNVAGATYSSIDEFRKYTAQAVREAARDLDTKTRLIYESGHLYVVRNIVTSSYVPFTTLVMEINMDRLFESVRNMVWNKACLIYLDGEEVMHLPEGLDREYRAELEQALETVGARMGTPSEGKYLVDYDWKTSVGCLTTKVNGQLYTFACIMDRSLMISDQSAFAWLYAIIFATLIPLMIATLHYFYRNINRPVDALIQVSDRIAGGEYGAQAETSAGNEEMTRLTEVFNSMSGELKLSFNRIYAEEVAERDARLKALQSQINPHFLNNTLEIINWKARMGGNEEVSEMIEALSVMMNASLNRENEMFVPLSEEMSYVDAYLYIIRQRFGSRFTFEVNVDNALLGEKIPKLIIQPLVENAVEHGGDEHGAIRGALHIRREEDRLIICVENNGQMTEEDRRKVKELLSPEAFQEAFRNDEKKKKKWDRRSIGIRNVNLRLKLIYGEESGLTITDKKNGVTVSRIVIMTKRRTSTDKTAQEETKQTAV